MSDKLEIKASEGLAPARRNFLFANSLLFVLGVGNPAEIKLPGFGDVSVPGVAAIAMVAVSVAWFLYEYSLEYILTRTRNSQFLAPRRAAETVESVGSAMQNLARVIESLQSGLSQVLMIAKSEADKLKGDQNIGHLTKTVSGLTVQLSEFSKRFPEYKGMNQITVMDDARQGELLRVSSSLQGVVNGLESVRSEWQRGGEHWQGYINLELEKITSTLSALHGDFRRVSDNVHTFQRRAMLWKDLVMITAFAGCSLGLAAIRIVFGVRSAIGQLDWIAVAAAVVGAVLALLVASPEIRTQFTRRTTVTPSGS